VATRKRTGLLAGAAVAALLAFPGIASAAVTSNVAGGALTVTSDAADPIEITAVGGQVKINGNNPDSGAVNANTITSITVTGGPGANTIDLDGVTVAAYPAITAVTVSGGAGNDTITGSEHNDRLIGGDNDDDVSGSAGNDTIVWNPGDDTDRNEGGAGDDTIEVNGGGGPETFTVKPSATAGRVDFARVPPTPNPPGNFALDIGTSERLDLNMNGGDDTVTADAGLDALGFKLDMDGGAGNDSIDGGDGGDLLKGGDGDDRIVPDDNPSATGGARDDARGDAGNDTIVWNGGDDDDINEGGDGIDTIEVNGAPANETFTVKPGVNGRILFDRTPPTPNPPGFFNIDIGTAERLDLNMNAGDDTLTTDGGFPGFKIDAEGGDGNDNIDGGDAADLLSGGNGDDKIVPDDNPEGTLDVARGDAGNDLITWNGGDDNDVNDGGDGDDTSQVNGATAGERFIVQPQPKVAGRVQFDRVSTNPAPFSIDIGTTERLLLNAGGGDDKILTKKGLAGLIKGEFNGDDGNDAIEGTDAEDRLNGGKGNDLINSRDKAEDLLDCGAGIDLAIVDRRDFLRNCNLVIGGHLRVKLATKKVAVTNDLAALPLQCAGTKGCKGVVRLRDGGKTLAEGKFNIKKRSKTVHLKLNGKGRRLLAGAPAGGESVSVQIDAKDGKGNGWRTTKKLTLTR
jgi:Ca2+-binding RTX toxin-like protein